MFLYHKLCVNIEMMYLIHYLT